MKWNLNKNLPICPQICEQLRVKIAFEEFKPNERLLSVREIAVEAGVNPNTVQKSLEQLESEGLIYSVRGSGWYVGENTELAKQSVVRMIREKTERYLADMAQFGYNAERVAELIKEWI